jgi:hypothetical protein
VVDFVVVKKGQGVNRKEAILADLQDRSRPDAAVARRHGVSRSWVGLIRQRAGLPVWTAPPKPPAAPSPVFWTEDDRAYLVDHAGDPVPELVAALGRSAGAVTGMRERLVRQGCIPKRRARYTEEDLALLADRSLTNAEVAGRTGRSLEVIAQSRRKRGIRGPQHALRPWTEDELERLVALHDRPTREVAALLGRSISAIRNQRHALLRQGRTPPRRRRQTRKTVP